MYVQPGKLAREANARASSAATLAEHGVLPRSDRRRRSGAVPLVAAATRPARCGVADPAHAGLGGAPRLVRLLRGPARPSRAEQSQRHYCRLQRGFRSRAAGITAAVTAAGAQSAARSSGAPPSLLDRPTNRQLTLHSHLRCSLTLSLCGAPLCAAEPSAPRPRRLGNDAPRGPLAFLSAAHGEAARRCGERTRVCRAAWDFIRAAASGSRRCRRCEGGGSSTERVELADEAEGCAPRADSAVL
jgi:hypothetical protein